MKPLLDIYPSVKLIKVLKFVCLNIISYSENVEYCKISKKRIYRITNYKSIEQKIINNAFTCIRVHFKKSQDQVHIGTSYPEIAQMIIMNLNRLLKLRRDNKVLQVNISQWIYNWSIPEYANLKIKKYISHIKDFWKKDSKQFTSFLFPNNKYRNFYLLHIILETLIKNYKQEKTKNLNNSKFFLTTHPELDDEYLLGLQNPENVPGLVKLFLSVISPNFKSICFNQINHAYRQEKIDLKVVLKDVVARKIFLLQFTKSLIDFYHSFNKNLLEKYRLIKISLRT